MAISYSECIHIDIEKGTEGGDTYWIEHPKWAGEEKALCFRNIKTQGVYGRPEDGRCGKAAGWGTEHEGTGACKIHGGNAGRYPSGKFTTPIAVSRLRRRVNEYVEQGEEQLLDLTMELATLRIIFSDLVDKFPNVGDDDYVMAVNRVQGLAQTISTTVDKMSRIQARHTLTAAQVVYIRAAIIDVFTKHIQDPDRRERAIADLMTRLPGGEEAKVPTLLAPGQ
jgi:hypothetical protein